MPDSRISIDMNRDFVHIGFVAETPMMFDFACDGDRFIV
jgi:hypothetical protein